MKSLVADSTDHIFCHPDKPLANQIYVGDRLLISDRIPKSYVLRSLEVFRNIRQAGKHLYPKLPNSGLTIDTSQMSPQAAAHEICEFFGLKKIFN
jgi:hypothetical protein